MVPPHRRGAPRWHHRRHRLAGAVSMVPPRRRGASRWRRARQAPPGVRGWSEGAWDVRPKGGQACGGAETTTCPTRGQGVCAVRVPRRLACSPLTSSDVVPDAVSGVRRTLPRPWCVNSSHQGLSGCHPRRRGSEQPFAPQRIETEHEVPAPNQDVVPNNPSRHSE